MRKTLAEISCIGKVVLCESCDRIHFMFGRLTLDLTREEFFGLKDLISNAVEDLGKTTSAHKPEIEWNQTLVSGKAALVH